MGNIDKKRTLIAAIRRNALAGYSDMELGISDDDLRFKTWEEIIKPHSNAVIIAMMDTSGSMGVFEKYIARSFFFWMVRFLRTKYEKVDIAFIAHHTDAKEVPEEVFFSKGESGERFVRRPTERRWKSSTAATRPHSTTYIRFTFPTATT